MNLKSILAHRNTALFVLIAFAYGAFIRFFRLDYQSFYLDEVTSVDAAMHADTLQHAFTHFFFYHPTPPLYFFALLGWTELFGFGEYMLRFPSAAFGVLTIPLIYFGFKQIYDRNIAAISAIIMAFSWPGLFYSQETRVYSIVLFFCTLAFIYWVKIINGMVAGSTRGWDKTIFLFAAFLAAMLHPFGMLVSGFQILYLLILALIRHRALIVFSFFSGLFVLAVYSLWIWVNLTHLGHTSEDSVTGNPFNRPGLGFFINIGAFLFHHPVVALLTAIIPMALGAAGYWKILKGALGQRDLTSPAIYLPAMMLFPFATVFIASLIYPLMYTRHLIVFLPYIYCFFAYIFVQQQWRWRGREAGVMLVLCIASTVFILPDYYQPHKTQAREGIAHALSNADENTKFVTPCDFEPPWECRLGPQYVLSTRWNVYLYYLNKPYLPDLPIVPDVARNTGELSELVRGYRENGIKKVTLIAIRKHLWHHYDSFKSWFGEAGFSCTSRIYESKGRDEVGILICEDGLG